MKEFDVYRLSEFYDVISAKPFNINIEQPIWFRGHECNNYELSPSIQRGFLPSINGNNSYSQTTLRESMRYQHFASRAMHSLNNNVRSKVEWQEVYQHHFGKTRMLDWTESARTALSFALISYLDTQNNAELDIKRKSSTPVVWMLNPQKLNETVYDFFSSNSEIIKDALTDLDCQDINKFTNDIVTELNKDNAKELYFLYDSDKSMGGILSLCMLDAYRTSNMSRMKSLVRDFAFNPFYYLSLRYYIDAVPNELSDSDKIMPPLAILQPYHSERIRSQRGVFTVFPNYILKDDALELYTLYNYDIRIMENQPDISDCLAKINILNPIQVARDLVCSGERKSELYPDVDVYVHVVETDKFHL